MWSEKLIEAFKKWLFEISCVKFSIADKIIIGTVIFSQLDRISCVLLVALIAYMYGKISASKNIANKLSVWVTKNATLDRFKLFSNNEKKLEEISKKKTD